MTETGKNEDSPIVEGIGTDPIICYFNSETSEPGEKLCINGFKHTCVLEYSPGGLSVHGAWLRDTPVKKCKVS